MVNNNFFISFRLYTLEIASENKMTNSCVRYFALENIN